MKISNLVEQIFAQAVALEQGGRFHNTIYASKRTIYIMNYDHTVLLRFQLRGSEPPFNTPVSFKANDYDSNIFEQVDGKIIFSSYNDGYEKRKICGTTDLTAEEVEKLFNDYKSTDLPRQVIQLSKTVLELLDENLSHIEFTGKKGETLTMIQRNIYSGGIIEIKKRDTGFFTEDLTQSFGPVAMKTNDFRALFNFQNTLKFSFPSGENQDFIIIDSMDKSKRDISGIIACCLYDEIIEIKEARHGRKKQEIRRG